jgi:hypothetical protein
VKYVNVFKRGDMGYWGAIVEEGSIAIPQELWEKYLAAELRVMELEEEIEEYADRG